MKKIPGFIIVVCMIAALWAAFIIELVASGEGGAAARNAPVTLFQVGLLCFCTVAALIVWKTNQRLGGEILRRETTQRELLEAKNHYRTLVDNLPQPVFRKDPQGRYVSVNRTFAQLFGRDTEHAPGSIDTDWFTPALSEKFRSDELKVLHERTTGESVDLLRVGNSDRWFSITRTPLVDGQGSVSGVLGVLRDITEQKTAHDALRETQRFNESVMRSTLDLVYIYDLIDDAVVYINPHLSELLGFTLAEVRAMGSGFHHRLIHADDQWLIDDMLVRCDGSRHDTVESLEMRMHDAVGRWLWFAGRYIVFRRDAGGRVCQVIGTLHDITERVTVENALRIAFDRAQRYLDIVEAVIVALDREGRITLINRKGAQLLGYTTADLMGKNWFETCLPPGERIAAVNLFNQQIAADGQSGERNEYSLVTADERIRHVSWYGNLLHDEKGAVIGMLCAGEDITERKLAEKVVKTEKFRQNILLTLSQVPGMSVNGVMDHALDTALLLTESVIGYLYFYSEAARQFTLYSWSKEAMNRCTVVERQTIYNLDETGLWGDAVRLRQPVITNEYPAANPRKKGLPEGHVHLQRHMNVPVFDDGVIVAVIGVANKEQPYDDDDIRHLQLLMDGIWKIKKRIDMEDQIRHLNEDLERKVDERTGELRRVHEELQRFFTLSLDLLCITDVNGRFVRCNKAWESMLGYSPGDIEQRRFLDFVHPDDLDATVAQFGELLKGRDVEFVNRYRGADGSYRWLEWHSTAAGNLMYAAARDITGKKHDEEVLIKAKDEADQANRAKSRFIANVSHEIRTPLNAVIGYSELLGAQAKGKKAQGYVESISLAGRNLLRLIDDILDLSKIEADMLTFRYGAVDLSVLLREIGQIFSFNIREKNLSFSVDTDSRLPRFLILDEVRMRQILLNIVGNAVKFTDEGHIRVTARCVPSSSERSMVDLDIVVEDTGIGIAPEEKETIFEAFRQQNNQLPRYGGTGLGLSISRKLLERMHGSITVESSPGKGSRFIIRLPDIAIASVVPTSLDSMEYGRGPAFPPLTVLVVDDIPSNRDMIAALLGQAGFKVLAAQNGEVAVELALRHRPDCIIMDVLMPVLDGIAAARILRREPLTASVPIIALTTMPSTELNDIGDAGLFSGRLGKPVFARDLFGELEKHLPGLTRGQRAEVREHDAGDGALSSDDNLPDSFRQKAGEFLGAVKMDDIRIFAQDLIDLGERNGKTVFIRVGKVLAEHADHFNVVEVKGILRKLAG